MDTQPSRGAQKTKAECPREDWGNHLADRLAGEKPEEVMVLTYRRAILIAISAREAIPSLLDRYQWYIGHPNTGPALTIMTDVNRW